MSRSMNKAMVCAAVVAGLGTLSALGAMSMPKSSSCLHSGHGARSRRIMGAVSNVTEEFADEFCMMAHKTGNAMIKTGRWINRLVP